MCFNKNSNFIYFFIGILFLYLLFKKSFIMSGDISKFLEEQRHYILEEKRRLGILENIQCAKEVGI